MEISASTLWWLRGGGAVAAQRNTGTVIRLVVAHGGVAAPRAAVRHVRGAHGCGAAAVIGGGATALWHWKRSREPAAEHARENRDVNLDIGERVQVAGWQADGTARVVYRGSTWSARLQPGAVAAPGMHLVAAVEGNWLVLAPASH